MHNLEIRTGVPHSFGAEILLDGKNISDACESVTVTVAANELNRVELNLCCAVTATVCANEVKATLSGSAREVLLTAGWTPPEVDA